MLAKKYILFINFSCKLPSSLSTEVSYYFHIIPLFSHLSFLISDLSVETAKEEYSGNRLMFPALWSL